MRKFLLHVCCAPCASSVLERLIENRLSDYEIALFYYNPNILPEEEYQKRLSELKRFLSEANYNKIELIEGAYEPEKFLEAVKGLENEEEGGERCRRCFEMRLSEAARTAKAREFEAFITTLTVSPHKNSATINEIVERLSKERGLEAFYSDFKKKNGYKRSIELSKKYNLYRQSYCGCKFDKIDAPQI